MCVRSRIVFRTWFLIIVIIIIIIIKLKTNSKFIKFQEEINGVIEELLEEDEMNITDINNLIYATATIMTQTQTLIEPSKRSQNRRVVKFSKIRMQKQISSWRKKLSIMAETGTGSDNGKLSRKKRKILKNIEWQMLGKLHSWQKHWSRKCKQKPKELEGMKKGKPSIIRIRCLKKTLKDFTETWAWKIYRPEKLPLWQKQRLTGSHYGGKKHIMKEQNG